jgi:hypothetical protein
MVRLADPACLRAHAARFDREALAHDGLPGVEALRLRRLLARPYEDLTAEEIALALALAEERRLPSLFAWCLPAALRRLPERDPLASDRLLQGILDSGGEPAVADWEPEVEAALAGMLASRPLRGGDDPVDLWISDGALRLRALERARRGSGRPRARRVPTWTGAREGPFYARLALVLLDRFPARAAARLAEWEAGATDNHARAWVETTFHANAMGWGPSLPGVFERLVSEERAARAHALVLHAETDVAIGAAATLLLLAPGRAEGLRDRVEGLLASVDASESDRFVVPGPVRRLLEGGVV